MALIGAGPAAGANLERLRRLATTAALAARQRHVARIAFVQRLPLDPFEAVQAVTEGLTLALFSGDRYKSQDRSGAAPEQMLVVAGSGASVGRHPREGCRTRAHPRRIVEHGARSLQRAGECLDAVCVCRARRSHRARRRARGRSPRRRRDRTAEHGPAARCCPRQRRTAARDCHDPQSAWRACLSRPRTRGQGHHVRHRRHLHQARRGHGADEGRHGGRRSSHRRHARHLAAESTNQSRRHRPGLREHAGGTRDQAGRRPDWRRR